MKATNPYYTAPDTDYAVSSTMPLTGHLGFTIDIPHTAPMSAGFYFGENPVIGRRELVTRADPEYFAIDHTIPMLTEKVPLVNLADPSYQFSRAKFTYHV